LPDDGDDDDDDDDDDEWEVGNRRIIQKFVGNL